MGSELKPCPFCGGTDASETSMDGMRRTVYFVSCNKCGACGPSRVYPDHTEPLTESELWNRRADPAKPDQSDLDRAKRVWNEWSVNEPLPRRSVYELLAALLAEVRAEERERIEAILKVLLDDLDIGEQYDKPGGMKPTRHPPLSRMLPTHRNHIRRMITAIRGMK